MAILDFFKKAIPPPKPIQPQRQLLTQELAIRTANRIMTNFSFSYMTPTELEKMLRDDTILSAFNKIFLQLSGREWHIKAVRDEDKEGAKELEGKYALLNMSSIIEKMAWSKFTGYQAQEILYDNELWVEKIKSKPNYWFNYDGNKKDWYFIADNGEYLYFSETPYKFLVTINDWSEDMQMGRSILEPLYKCWKLKELALNKEGYIVQNYGDIITYFAYDPTLTGTEAAALASDVKDMMRGGNVVGMPVNEFNSQVQFITLDQFKTEVHASIINQAVDAINVYLLGSNVSNAVGQANGSNAQAVTLNEVSTNMIEGYAKYIRDSFQNVINWQGELKGFDGKKYYLSLDSEVDRQKEEQTKSAIVDKYVKLKTAGIKVGLEYISQDTGIPIEQLSYEVSQPAIQNFERIEFAEKKKSRIQLKLEKARKQEKEFTDSMLEVLPNIADEVSKNYIKQISKIKSIEDIEKIGMEWTETTFDEAFTIARLKGMDSVSKIVIEAFAEKIDPFKMKFEEAIKFFVDKDPVLFADIEDVEDEIRSQYFWVKKATDLEMTKRIYKNLKDAIDNGSTFKEWLNVMEPEKIASKAYLETVFRTNLVSAYSAGRYNEQMKSKNEPYWLYSAILDGRTTEICFFLNGKVYKQDDPIWSKIYPPNHYNERSIVIALDKEDLEEEGLKVANSDRIPEEDLKVLKDSGFGYNPAIGMSKSMEKLVNKKDEEVKELRKLVS